MSSQSRRAFIGTAVAAGALAMSCSKSGAPKVENQDLPQQAPDGPELTAGLIGCGGRGTGAAINFLKAGPKLKLTAMGDVFQDRIDGSLKRIEEQTGATVPKDRCFVGFNAFEKVIASGVDIVILATPPHFRPEHCAAAVDAGKHVFMEKPIAVDPVGIKSILKSVGQARTKNLVIVTGTQRHHQRGYVDAYARVKAGAIGDIVAARCYWDQRQLWFRERQPGWSDMEWMIRDWVNWTWLSGDHIVEQHVHNIDVINWFVGDHPVKAVGFGARHRRVTGDQYDFFSVDFEFENGMHCASYCRQIDGCANNVSEFIVGSEGSTNCADTIWNPDGSIKWKFVALDEGQAEEAQAYEVTYAKKVRSPYDQEHTDMVAAIRRSETLNEGQLTAESTLNGIMGRISAYTGKEVTWQEMMDSDLRLGPDTYSLGKVDMQAVVPVPGGEQA